MTTTRLREEYNKERDQRGERSFYSDLYNSERGDVNAHARISQFQAEERATGTAAYAGLVVPQYLVEQAAVLARAGRPFADTCQSLQIPDEGPPAVRSRGRPAPAAQVRADRRRQLDRDPRQLRVCRIYGVALRVSGGCRGWQLGVRFRLHLTDVLT